MGRETSDTGFSVSSVVGGILMSVVIIVMSAIIGVLYSDLRWEQ